MTDTYKKSKGNAGLDGVQFQLNLLTVVLLNALRNRKNWKISTENQQAGKFDDLVLELEDKCVLLQAKFKQSKKINKDQIFSCNSKTSDFSLPKYFFSYLEVKSESMEKTVIVCTNTNIDGKGLKGFLTRRITGPDSTLHYEGAPCQFFTFNENILPDLKTSVEIYLDKNLQGKGFEKEAVTEENMKDFLDHLQFFSSYPNRDKLDKIIEQLLFRLNNSSLYRRVSSQELYKKVEDWFKQPKGEYLTEDRARAMFSEIKSDKYREELNNYNVSFKHNNVDFADPKRIFQINSEGGRLLRALKVCGVLESEGSKQLYVNPDGEVDEQKCVVEAFGLPRYTFLIIVGIKITEETAIRELSNKLKDVLEKYSFKKVIFVDDSSDGLGQQIGLNISHVDGYVSFKDLSDECQDRLVKDQRIVFQGKQVSLEELLATQAREVWARAINSEILEKLIRKKEIKVGERPFDLNERNSQYYISRTFKRQQETCREVTISLNLDEESCNNEEVYSEEDIYDMVEDVILISDVAGTGKSTVLTNLAATIKDKNPHLWVIKIELAEYTTILRDSLNNREGSISAMKLLNSKKATELTNHLERFVFSMNKKVVLMLDGIDEISPDYTELVLDLLAQCRQAANFDKLFVATRPHMILKLEEVLRVKPFVLQPFTEQNQVDFLASYWMHNLGTDGEDERKYERYARALVNRMTSWTKGYGDKEDDFTAIPLQLRMLAEIFQEDTKSEELVWQGCKEYLKDTRTELKLPEKMVIKELYDTFIEKKRNIYVYKGNPCGNAAANGALNKQFDEMLVHHRILALDVILYEEHRRLFSCYQEGCEDRNESMLKIGIVQKSNGKIHFIHRTFAEYFVAKSLVSELLLQLRNPNVKFQELFVKILQCSEFLTVHVFLNNFLKEVLDSIPSNVFEKYYSYTCHKNRSNHKFVHLLAQEGYTVILQFILKCVDFKIIRDKEIDIPDVLGRISLKKKNVFQYLAGKIGINRQNKNENLLVFIQTIVQEGGINIRDLFGRTPLHYAANRGHFETIDFLAEQGARIDSADKNGQIPLHFAALNGHLDAVKLLHGLGQDVNTGDGNGLTALHLAARNGHLKTVKFLLEQGADFNAGDFHGRTPLHFAASYGHLDSVKFLLERGADFNFGDNYGRTALQFSAWKGHLDTVKFLIELGADFVAGDNDGLTALHLAASNGHLDTVQCLLELASSLSKTCGDVNVKDVNGRMPLHFAASNGHLETVKFLLQLDADFGIGDGDGNMAQQLALAKGHLQIVDYFEDRNKKEM
ncbi:uncharacterized protein LOC108916237 [Anoplophora glabripennis]|uniref:uncharacterized protein LOC108916237 n=1 Tax=Anoplophora glabripennis TaxID=217634 RepID=UPI00087438C7|nr:uncharacterized protein LOC108916237 [Anoplophora glabripennis]